MSSNLFAYGTLMCPDIMQMVAGELLVPVSAVLSGYARYSIVNEDYPGLMPGLESEVQGQLYLNLSGRAWSRLDAFEGEMYERRSVRVILDSHDILEAQTYVIRPRYYDCLSEDAWSFEHFLQHTKHKFLRQYAGFELIR